MIDYVLRVVWYDLCRVGGATMIAVFGSSLPSRQTTNGIIGDGLRLSWLIVMLAVMRLGSVLRAINRTLIGMVVVDVQARWGLGCIGGWLIGVRHIVHPFEM
jgi:hypothetical protein